MEHRKSRSSVTLGNLGGEVDGVVEVSDSHWATLVEGSSMEHGARREEDGCRIRQPSSFCNLLLRLLRWNRGTGRSQ